MNEKIVMTAKLCFAKRILENVRSITDGETAIAGDRRKWGNKEETLLG